MLDSDRELKENIYILHWYCAYLYDHEFSIWTNMTPLNAKRLFDTLHDNGKDILLRLLSANFKYNSSRFSIANGKDLHSAAITILQANLNMDEPLYQGLSQLIFNLQKEDSLCTIKLS